jgi:hypothetical protein
VINQVKIKIPYQYRWGIFSLTFNRWVWFAFDNLSLFLFRERLKIETADDFAKWRKENGEHTAMIQAAYSAAESYYLSNKKPFKLDLKKFAIGFSSAKKEDLQKLIDVCKRSQQYGAAELPGKKKAKVKA